MPLTDSFMIHREKNRRQLNPTIPTQSYLCSVYRLVEIAPRLIVTLARPSESSSLQVNNRSFTYASPYLWNQLPSSFRQPHSVHCPLGSPHFAHITSSQSPNSLSSPITASTFHSRLKTHLFHKSFPPYSHSYSFRTDFTDLNQY